MNHKVENLANLIYKATKVYPGLISDLNAMLQSAKGVMVLQVHAFLVHPNVPETVKKEVMPRVVEMKASDDARADQPTTKTLNGRTINWLTGEISD